MTETIISQLTPGQFAATRIEVLERKIRNCGRWSTGCAFTSMALIISNISVVLSNLSISLAIPVVIGSALLVVAAEVSKWNIDSRAGNLKNELLTSVSEKIQIDVAEAKRAGQRRRIRSNIEASENARYAREEAQEGGPRNPLSVREAYYAGRRNVREERPLDL